MDPESLPSKEILKLVNKILEGKAKLTTKELTKLIDSLALCSLSHEDINKESQQAAKRIIRGLKTEMDYEAITVLSVAYQGICDGESTGFTEIGVDLCGIRARVPKSYSSVIICLTLLYTSNKLGYQLLAMEGLTKLVSSSIRLSPKKSTFDSEVNLLQKNLEALKPKLLEGLAQVGAIVVRGFEDSNTLSGSSNDVWVGEKEFGSNELVYNNLPHMRYYFHLLDAKRKKMTLSAGEQKQYEQLKKDITELENLQKEKGPQITWFYKKHASEQGMKQEHFMYSFLQNICGKGSAPASTIKNNLGEIELVYCSQESGWSGTENKKGNGTI